MLSSITLHSDLFRIPKEDNLNIYMGLGLWAGCGKLSAGLPVDVINMLLPAKVIEAERGSLYNKGHCFSC